MKFYVMTNSGHYMLGEAGNPEDLPEELDLDVPYWKSIACIIYKKWWRYRIEDVEKGELGKIKFRKEGNLYYALALGRCGFGETKEIAMIDLMYKFVTIGRGYTSDSKGDCFINLYNH